MLLCYTVFQLIKLHFKYFLLVSFKDNTWQKLYISNASVFVMKADGLCILVNLRSQRVIKIDQNINCLDNDFRSKEKQTNNAIQKVTEIENNQVVLFSSCPPNTKHIKNECLLLPYKIQKLVLVSSRSFFVQCGVSLWEPGVLLRGSLAGPRPIQFNSLLLISSSYSFKMVIYLQSFS